MKMKNLLLFTIEILNLELQKEKKTDKLLITIKLEMS